MIILQVVDKHIIYNTPGGVEFLITLRFFMNKSDIKKCILKNDECSFSTDLDLHISFLLSSFLYIYFFSTVLYTNKYTITRHMIAIKTHSAYTQFKLLKITIKIYINCNKINVGQDKCWTFNCHIFIFFFGKIESIHFFWILLLL